MSAASAPIRIVAICDSGPTEQQITVALGSQDDFQLAGVLNSIERLTRDIATTDPGIVIIDHTIEDRPGLDIIDDIAQQFPNISIVAVVHENDPVEIQKVILAGARSFIIKPFSQLNLLSTLRRIQELESRRTRLQPSTSTKEARATHPLQTVTVFSPRGGTGCTSTAINLAIAIHEETNRRVLLFDGKFFFGHLDVMLNIRTQNTIADLIPHAHALDESLVSEVAPVHASGIHVLPGPKNFQVSQGIRADDLYSTFIGLQRYFDYIVVDGGSVLTENIVTLMDASDRILLLTTPDLASLHDVSLFVQISRTLAYPSEKILIGLNREGMEGGVKSSDIETALRHQVYFKLPDDGANVIRSINRGIPLLLRYPRSPVAKAIRSLAQNLINMKLAELPGMAATAAMEKGKREALMASSQFG